MKTDNFNTNFLKRIENEPVVSHRIIAKEIFEFDLKKKDNTETQLRNKTTQVKELITDNLSDFEEFGKIRFETEAIKNSKNRINQQITYFLNEPQATLLLTFMRNSKKIKKFKVLLVKEFFKMRSILRTTTPKTQFQELQETLEFIDIFDKFSEKIENRSKIELLKLDDFLTKSEKRSVLDILNIDLKNSYFSVTELGEFSGKGGAEINQDLAKIGFQIQKDGVWKVLENGDNFCFETKNRFSQLKWKFEVLEKIEVELNFVNSIPAI